MLRDRTLQYFSFVYVLVIAVAVLAVGAIDGGVFGLVALEDRVVDIEAIGLLLLPCLRPALQISYRLRLAGPSPLHTIRSATSAVMQHKMPFS